MRDRTKGSPYLNYNDICLVCILNSFALIIVRGDSMMTLLKQKKKKYIAY